jgi:hypothetical protein
MIEKKINFNFTFVIDNYQALSGCCASAAGGVAISTNIT